MLTLQEYGMLVQQFLDRHHQEAGHILEDNSSMMAPVGLKILPEDGHCSFRPGNENCFLADTYPNNNSRQQLLAYNMNNDNMLILGDFYSPSTHAGKGYRCDLHPRWSRCGNYVCIDSLQNGTRQMYVYDIRQALDNSLL